MSKYNDKDLRLATLKFVLVGNTLTGKSNIISKYVDGNFEVNESKFTEVTFKSKNYIYNDIKVKEQIWDTCGLKKFQSLAGVYLRNADGVLIVYDITNKESFDEISNWVQIVKSHCKPIIAIVGNKLDLEHKRQVSYEEAFDFATREGYMYFETSCYSGKNIDLVFSELSSNVIKNINVEDLPLASRCDSLRSQSIKSTKSTNKLNHDELNFKNRSWKSMCCCSIY